MWRWGCSTWRFIQVCQVMHLDESCRKTSKGSHVTERSFYFCWWGLLVMFVMNFKGSKRANKFREIFRSVIVQNHKPFHWKNLRKAGETVAKTSWKNKCATGATPSVCDFEQKIEMPLGVYFVGLRKWLRNTRSFEDKGESEVLNFWFCQSATACPSKKTGREDKMFQ